MIVHLLLIAGAIVFLFPFLWMLSTALKPIEQVMTLPPRWIPKPILWRNFIEVFKTVPFLKYTINTLYVSVLTIIGTLISSSLVGYGFSRIKWRGRNTLFIFVLATMMIPFPVTMIPLYAVFRRLHWIGTFMPLWVPAFFGNAFSIFLLRQFFLTIPRELSEAAVVDGCSELRIFSQIILPLARPALLVVALFQFMYTWNDFLGPLIYLTSQDKFTLSLGLQFFQSQHGGTQWNLLMAAATMMLIPVVILFLFTQRYFIEGISLTGLKG